MTTRKSYNLIPASHSVSHLFYVCLQIPFWSICRAVLQSSSLATLALVRYTGFHHRLFSSTGKIHDLLAASYLVYRFNASNRAFCYASLCRPNACTVPKSNLHQSYARITTSGPGAPVPAIPTSIAPIEVKGISDIVRIFWSLNGQKVFALRKGWREQRSFDRSY